MVFLRIYDYICDNLNTKEKMHAMELKKLEDDFYVSAQIALDELPAIAKQGFKTLICNRPDGENMGQPSFEAIEKAAAELGLACKWLPVTAPTLTNESATAMGALIADSEKPILAYCRTGTRCTVLWGLDQAIGKKRPVDEIEDMASHAGYDLSERLRQF